MYHTKYIQVSFFVRFVIVQRTPFTFFVGGSKQISSESVVCLIVFYISIYHMICKMPAHCGAFARPL